MKLLTLAVFLCSCGDVMAEIPGTPENQARFTSLFTAETRCGMRTVQGQSLERLQRAEDIALKDLAFAGVTCESLKGWTVLVKSKDQRMYMAHLVAGLTFCAEKRVEIGIDWWALYHELIHAAGCPDKNQTHVDWAENGFHAILAKLGTPE